MERFNVITRVGLVLGGDRNPVSCIILILKAAFILFLFLNLFFNSILWEDKGSYMHCMEIEIEIEGYPMRDLIEE